MQTTLLKPPLLPVPEGSVAGFEEYGSGPGRPGSAGRPAARFLRRGETIRPQYGQLSGLCAAWKRIFGVALMIGEKD
ncbi:hypothetical protein GCM10010387_35880 [Streptomyces inusitatus]|uniref:Uncharacterized protein n=1 Tax=Streptomyces inusitatus TaxID=68221 RepID=A0A918UWB2_9ACTN|nr:hypothetical protein GCM10010387_35880 [Streptomyces inusitatus]